MGTRRFVFVRWRHFPPMRDPPRPRKILFLDRDTLKSFGINI